MAFGENSEARDSEKKGSRGDSQENEDKTCREQGRGQGRSQLDVFAIRIDLG